MHDDKLTIDGGIGPNLLCLARYHLLLSKVDVLCTEDGWSLHGAIKGILFRHIEELAAEQAKLGFRIDIGSSSTSSSMKLQAPWEMQSRHRCWCDHSWKAKKG